MSSLYNLCNIDFCCSLSVPGIHGPSGSRTDCFELVRHLQNFVGYSPVLGFSTFSALMEQPFLVYGSLLSTTKWILSWFNNKIHDIKCKENTNNKYKRFILKFQMYFKAWSHHMGFKYKWYYSPYMGFYSRLFLTLLSILNVILNSEILWMTIKMCKLMD